MVIIKNQVDELSVSYSERSAGLNSFTREKGIPWWSYIWDHDQDRTQNERHFVRKLDRHLLAILCLGYFIKTLDQTNIANAYVSGMKESLSMTANEINHIDIACTIGYVLGQLPSQFILTKVRPSIWIPSCELVWTLLTFSLAGTTTSSQVIVIRLFVGLVESIFYPAAHFLMGSWYTPSELGKRAAIFHASASAASILSGYLQAGVYRSLNGAFGKAGWQWLFIMDGLISLPICLVGCLLIPDLPENTRAFYLDSNDTQIARARMIDVGRAPRKKLGWHIIRNLLTKWHIYALAPLYVIFINTGSSSSVSPFSLWLKDQGWSVSMINIIPTVSAAISFVATVSLAILSDSLRSRALVMCISTIFGLVSSILLLIWTIPAPLKWLAFLITKIHTAYGPLAMSWANEICASSSEERAIVLGFMNASGYAFHTWLPLLTYPAKDAPRFKKGFTFSVLAFTAQFGITGLVAFLWRKEKNSKSSRMEDSEEDDGQRQLLLRR